MRQPMYNTGCHCSEFWLFWIFANLYSTLLPRVGRTTEPQMALRTGISPLRGSLRAAPIAWKLWLDRSTCVNAVMARGLPRPLLNGLTRSSPYGRRLMRFPAQVSSGASFVSLVHSLMLFSSRIWPVAPVFVKVHRGVIIYPLTS